MTLWVWGPYTCSLHLPLNPASICCLWVQVVTVQEHTHITGSLMRGLENWRPSGQTRGCLSLTQSHSWQGLTWQQGRRRVGCWGRGHGGCCGGPWKKPLRPDGIRKKNDEKCRKQSEREKARSPGFFFFLIIVFYITFIHSLGLGVIIRYKLTTQSEKSFFEFYVNLHACLLMTKQKVHVFMWLVCINYTKFLANTCKFCFKAFTHIQNK